MSVVLAVNGEKFSLNDVDPSVSLNDFIRRSTKYSGTKLACGEGGCGACAVQLSRVDPVSGQIVNISANSCIRPLASMDGWAVTTTEGLGGPKGYHPIQERIAAFNGLQCGFCTPGMVVTAYTALKTNNGEISMKDMEKQLDGNLCRCTGYRPILDACKSFAKDTDIEDLVCSSKCGGYDACKDPSFPEFLQNHKSGPATFKNHERTWIRANKLSEVFDLLEEHKEQARLVVANTSIGIYKTETARVLIEAQNIPELLEVTVDDNQVRFGAAVTLTTLKNTLSQIRDKSDSSSARYNSLSAFITHVERIAGVHVRNVGSIGGNLVLAKTKGFVSDLATICLGAEVVAILQTKEGEQKVALAEFLATPAFASGQILRGIEFPLFQESQVYNTYKASIRPVNAHAFLNAAFNLHLGENKVITKAVLAFGGVQEFDRVGSHPVLAVRTQEFLKDKPISEETFREAVTILEEEIKVEDDSHRREYRQNLVSGFFLKFFSSLTELSVDSARSAGTDLFKTRPLQKGTQKFPVYDDAVPIHKPVPKRTGPSLAAGDARFTDDAPAAGVLFASFVQTTKGRATIDNIDFTEALSAPGVRGYVSAADIPGKNSISAQEHEYIFADKYSEFHGQQAGLIVADTLRHAEAAAKLVKITYSNELPPILTTEEARKHEEYDFKKTEKYEKGNAEETIEKSPHQVSGRTFIKSQQHFYMETQSCEVHVDEERCVVVHSSGQWPQQVHAALAQVLDLPQHKIRVVCRRAGGGFGGKLLHNIPVACATALAAVKFDCRVRMAVNRNVDSAFCGGREEITQYYKAGFDNTGKITALTAETHLNTGFARGLSDFSVFAFSAGLSQTYKLPEFYINSALYKTNLPSRTSVRAPSEPASSYCMETIIEHIAHELQLPSDQVRQINFIEVGDKLPDDSEVDHFSLPTIWNQLQNDTKEDELRKQVNEFNENNRWKKRGISKTPVRYSVSVVKRSATVSVYKDGSIIIHHDTADIGQGAHEKVMQFVSHHLGQLFTPAQPVPLELIRCGDNDTSFSPTATYTGGSTSSESSCVAAEDACKQLLSRLQPLLAEMEKKGKEINWKNVCAFAEEQGKNLSALGWCEGGLAYQNYGGCVSVVEIDVITGDLEILESHLLYDCGKALNPAIDIGQAEGAFIMGLGFMLTEDVLINDKTGELISNGTWEYKIPSYRNIPQVFNIELLQNAAYPKGIASSKAVGEPPLVLSTSVAFAAREAIKAARKDVGLTDFFNLTLPITTEQIQLACCGSKFAVK